MNLPASEVALLSTIRRDLHQNPELSFFEERTASRIEDELNAIGITHQRLAKTGVVGLIEGAHPGPTLLFRADIDALPIEELSDIAYKSQNKGVMHACGHDVHTTIGIGVARALMSQREHLHGRIKLVFQPAEEASPENEPIGAERMVVEGVLENPKVDAAFAFHVMPTLDVGKIGYTGGPCWARSDLFEITITGKKTHAAYPHEGIDAVVVAAQMVTALQTLVSRRVDARDAAVISVGKLEAGNSYNIIADRAVLTGIIRTLSDDVADLIATEMNQLCTQLAVAFGAEAHVRLTAGARLTANDPGLEHRTVQSMRTHVGADTLVPIAPQMGAEDFASFSRRVPSCYLFLGVRNEARGIVHMIHTPFFDVDEACLPLAVRAMSQALLDLGRDWTGEGT
jgi:amidohydrolase